MHRIQSTKIALKTTDCPHREPTGTALPSLTWRLPVNAPSSVRDQLASGDAKFQYCLGTLRNFLHQEDGTNPAFFRENRNL